MKTVSIALVAAFALATSLSGAEAKAGKVKRENHQFNYFAQQVRQSS